MLFGNIPSKGFILDESGFRDADIAAQAEQLVRRMAACGHPFIIGSECDVLCVAGAEQRIRRKVSAMLGGCGCGGEHAGASSSA